MMARKNNAMLAPLAPSFVFCSESNDALAGQGKADSLNGERGCAIRGIQCELRAA
jgi:hypothetical protein